MLDFLTSGNNFIQWVALLGAVFSAYYFYLYIRHKEHSPNLNDWISLMGLSAGILSGLVVLDIVLYPNGRTLGDLAPLRLQIFLGCVATLWIMISKTRDIFVKYRPRKTAY